MCDCYGHKCECCNEIVQMHIADYSYPQTDFKVWCEACVENAPVGAVVFETTGVSDWGDEPVGWTCAIMGPDVGKHGGNHPNIANDWTEGVIRRG